MLSIRRKHRRCDGSMKKSDAVVLLFVVGQFLLTTNNVVLAQTATTGTGCYDVSTNQCNCDESVCVQQSCEASGGVWTDGCMSCQCTNGSASNVTSDNDDVDATTEGAEGFGCYSLPEAPTQCTCTEEYCEEDLCLAGNGTWTDRCTSCACGGGNSTSGENGDDDSFGCYSLPDAPMQCTCTEEYCEEDLCFASNGTWTDGCTSCSCGAGNSTTGSNGGGFPDDGDSTTGWGCYDVTVNRCGCAPEFCAQDTCEEAGGIFTDGCGTCKCVETFPPGVTPIAEQDNGSNGNGTGPTSPTPNTATNPSPSSPPTFPPRAEPDSSGLQVCVLTRSLLLTVTALLGFVMTT
jgi:hypothetical protein